MSIVQPEIDVVLGKVDSKFTLCTLSAKRARQINDMIHGARDQALNVMAYSEISKLQSAKPLSLSMEEIAKGDVSAIGAPDDEDEAAFNAAGDIIIDDTAADDIVEEILAEAAVSDSGDGEEL